MRWIREEQVYEYDNEAEMDLHDKEMTKQGYVRNDIRVDGEKRTVHYVMMP